MEGILYKIQLKVLRPLIIFTKTPALLQASAKQGNY
jgi:hypothetical protein